MLKSVQLFKIFGQKWTTQKITDPVTNAPLIIVTEQQEFPSQEQPKQAGSLCGRCVTDCSDCMDVCGEKVLPCILVALGIVILASPIIGIVYKLSGFNN